MKNFAKRPQSRSPGSRPLDVRSSASRRSSSHCCSCRPRSCSPRPARNRGRAAACRADPHSEARHREALPPAQLARDLPGDAERLERLREPASTAQAQVGIALDELRQMSALHLRPPLPAGAGRRRARLCRGQRPGSADRGRRSIPDYLGLEQELAENTSRLHTSGRDAAKALGAIKRLNRDADPLDAPCRSPGTAASSHARPGRRGSMNR